MAADHSKTRHNLCPKNGHSKSRQSGIGIVTVFKFFFQKFEAAEKAAEEAKRAKELQQKAETK